MWRRPCWPPWLCGLLLAYLKSFLCGVVLVGSST